MGYAHIIIIRGLRYIHWRIVMRGRKTIHSVSSREYKYGILLKFGLRAGNFRISKKEVLHAAEKENESYRSSLY